MEKVSVTKSFFFRFYKLCENFSKIGPIIKKIPKFQSDPLNFMVERLSHVLRKMKRGCGSLCTLVSS